MTREAYGLAALSIGMGYREAMAATVAEVMSMVREKTKQQEKAQAAAGGGEKEISGDLWE